MHGRNRWKLTLLVLLVGSGVGGAASADDYFCYVLGYDAKKLYFYSQLLSTAGHIDDTKTGLAYCEELEPKTRRNPEISGGHRCSCSSGNPAYIKDLYARHAKIWPGGPHEQVVFSFPPVPSTPVEDTPGASVLVIEKPVGPTPEQLRQQAEAEDALRRADAAEAQRRASAAAQAAQNDAQAQALLEAERERRRQCPSCQ
jgi:hypothetical protein